MYRYKLLRGSHSQGAVVNPKTGKKTASRHYKMGDVVESHLKLDERFGKNKFELVGTVQDEPAEQVDRAETAVIEPDDEWEGGTETSDGLDDMTVRELKAYAEEEGIDLGNASRKTDIVDVIREETALREEG